MEKILAHGDRAQTPAAAQEPGDRFPSSPSMPMRKPAPATRRPVAVATRPATKRPVAIRKRGTESSPVADGFYRDLVWNLRNGVLAVTRAGDIAVMNEVAYRILGLQLQ